jgi:hypothetical protein
MAPAAGPAPAWSAFNAPFMIEQSKQSTGAADAPGIEAPQVEKLNHADKLAVALRDLRDEVKLGKLNVRRDFSLMVAHASATKALAAYQSMKGAR